MLLWILFGVLVCIGLPLSVYVIVGSIAGLRRVSELEKEFALRELRTSLEQHLRRHHRDDHNKL